MATFVHAASLLANVSSSSLTNEAGGETGDVGVVVGIDDAYDAARYAVDGGRLDWPS
jgi:hypothetical protein